MNNSICNALRYVQNTNGGATLDDFVDDHDPIGTWLWRDVTVEGLAEVNVNGCVQLTPKGEEALRHSQEEQK